MKAIDRPSKIVLNYNRTIYGIYTANNILIPIAFDCPLYDNNLPCIYLDHLLREHTTNLNVQEVVDTIKKTGFFKTVGASKVKKQGSLLVLTENPGKIVPIGTINLSANKYTSTLNDDIAIFVEKELVDDRVLFVERTKQNDLLYKSFLHHILTVIDHDDINFLRHESNPLRKYVKRNLLHDIINKDNVMKMIYIDRADTMKAPNILHDKTCMSFKERQLCLDPCKWVSVKGNETCKLRVHHTLLDLFVDRAIEDLLNPLFNLKQTNTVMKQHDDMIIFTDSDDKLLNKRIQEPVIGKYSDVVIRNKEERGENADSPESMEELLVFKEKRTKKLPVKFGSMLPNMIAYVQDPYPAKFFSNLARFVADVDVEKNDVTSFVEATGIHVILLGTNKDVEPDGFKCYMPSGKENAASVIFLLKKKDQYLPIADKFFKVITPIDSLSQELQELVRKKCKRYIILEENTI